MTQGFARRTFLGCLASLGFLGTALADEVVTKTTAVYKTVGPCAVALDVFAKPSKTPRPAAIWIHGGALIMGRRSGIDPRLRDALVERGYAVVSIDYRLAPETKLPEILEDVGDAVRWVREEGARRFTIAPEKIAVLGGSAGGYLTLTTGYRVAPRPRALVSFWGYGDIVGPWYSQPDRFYRTMPLVPEDEARKAVGTEVLSASPPKDNRGRFYLYCRQNGLWPKEVTGHDPAAEPDWFDPYCPIRNVDARYPPTLLIHGTKDTDVPYDLSKSMAEELARKGVPNDLITVEGAGHGLSGAGPEVIPAIYARVLTFLAERLK